MIGFIVFLILLFIVVILLKMILQEVAPDPKFLKIGYLVIFLLAVLWLFGGGGWTYVHTWHP